MNPNSNQKRIAFGYNRDCLNQIQLHTGQAATVKLIYVFYVDGKSNAEIAKILESLNIPSPQNKRKWGTQTISNILSNPHYLGGDSYIPIVDQETYNRVQLIKRKRAPIFRK